LLFHLIDQRIALLLDLILESIKLSAQLAAPSDQLMLLLAAQFFLLPSPQFGGAP
jgi:hypothetical protein